MGHYGRALRVQVRSPNGGPGGKDPGGGGGGGGPGAKPPENFGFFGLKSENHRNAIFERNLGTLKHYHIFDPLWTLKSGGIGYCGPAGTEKWGANFS